MNSTALTKAFVLGKFDYSKDSTFTQVNIAFTHKTVFLKKETYNAFLAMADSAKKSGITLAIYSGTRNYVEQKSIWERKWNKYGTLKPLERVNKILEYSAMPGSSRHHWGTDIDLNSLNNSYFNRGNGLKVYMWLKNNANTFGFYQVYTDKSSGRKGYNLEKWHWSYLPLASKYLKFYNAEVTSEDIEGFSGSEYAEQVNIIDDYVNGLALSVKNYK
ncbi:MAG: M15 family metallopeptidase [Winogradskyella sp.]|nr:M15 family metallopeptidase [Winogradskyella sp.]